MSSLEKKSNYATYIDESGDLGVRVGTKWFVLSAIMVRCDDEPVIREALKSIRAKLNVNEIHYRKLFDFYKKAYVAREVSALPFTFANVIIDTDKVELSRLSSTAVVYNFACKILLERVSWFMQEKHGVTDVILSARGTSKDAELIEYIETKLLPYQSNNIDCACFNNVKAKQSSSWDLLQLADVCATSMFLSYEKNKWGLTVPCHVRPLKPHLYKHNGKIYGYGIKYMYSEMRADVKTIRECYPCDNTCK